MNNYARIVSSIRGIIGNYLLDASITTDYNRPWRPYIPDLASRTSPLNEPPSQKVFVVLQAYFDESGTQDGAHNCVVGGYWGGVNHWKRFERAWKAVLDSEGVPEYHSSNFWAGRKEFKGWDHNKRVVFIDRLLEIIEGSKIYPFACGVLASEWENMSYEEKCLMCGSPEEYCHKPTIAVLMNIIVGTTSYCKPGITMHYVFDAGPKTGVVAESFGQAKKAAIHFESQDHHVGDLVFADSKLVTPLQAADLLAYEAHYWAKNAKGDPNYPARIYYQRALHNIRHLQDFCFYDKDRVNFLRRTIMGPYLDYLRSLGIIGGSTP